MHPHSPRVLRPRKGLSLNIVITPPPIDRLVKGVEQRLIVRMLVNLTFGIAALQTIDHILLELRENLLRNGIGIILVHIISIQGPYPLNGLTAIGLLNLLQQLILIVHNQILYQADDVFVDDVKVGGHARLPLKYVLELQLLRLAGLH